MGNLHEGARNAIQGCLGVSAGERVLILTDASTLVVARALCDAVRAVTSEPRVFLMEEFGSRDIEGCHPLPFPSVVDSAFDDTDVFIYCARAFPGEFASFRKPMNDAFLRRPRIRSARMIEICERIMAEGMCVDYAQVERLSRALGERFRNARSAHVITPAGTDVRVTLDPRYKVIECNGNLRKGATRRSGNLPGGEVFTCPGSVDGTVVIDGLISEGFMKPDLLRETPVTVEFRGGHTVAGSLRCKNEQLQRELDTYLFSAPERFTHRLGEFAMGTNEQIRSFIGNMLQDEKFPSVHFAWGSPIPTATDAEWDSPQHCDFILIEPTVWLDDVLVMKDGKHLL